MVQLVQGGAWRSVVRRVTLDRCNCKQQVNSMLSMTGLPILKVNVVVHAFAYTWGQHVTTHRLVPIRRSCPFTVTYTKRRSTINFTLRMTAHVIYFRIAWYPWCWHTGRLSRRYARIKRCMKGSLIMTQIKLVLTYVMHVYSSSACNRS